MLYSHDDGNLPTRPAVFALLLLTVGWAHVEREGEKETEKAGGKREGEEIVDWGEGVRGRG